MKTWLFTSLRRRYIQVYTYAILSTRANTQEYLVARIKEN